MLAGTMASRPRRRRQRSGRDYPCRHL